MLGVALTVIDIGFRVGEHDNFDTRLAEVLVAKSQSSFDSVVTEQMRTVGGTAQKPYSIYARGVVCTNCNVREVNITVEQAPA